MNAQPAPLRALLLDVEGVLAHPDVARADQLLDRIRPGLRRAEVQARRDGPALRPQWARYSVGAIDGPTYWGAVLTALDLPPQGPSLDAMLALQAETGWARFDAELHAFSRALAAEHGLRLGILSNSAPDHERWIPRLSEGFDVLRFSHRVGARKPDEAAFAGALEALDLPAESVFFVDDKPRNVEAARRLGFPAHRFTKLESLRRALARLGLSLPASHASSGASGAPTSSGDSGASTSFRASGARLPEPSAKVEGSA